MRFHFSFFIIIEIMSFCSYVIIKKTEESPLPFFIIHSSFFILHYSPFFAFRLITWSNQRFSSVHTTTSITNTSVLFI